MDPRLLQYYNSELQHLREMGAEFAEQFPKIAARLGMQGIEVADPYVERLLEGVSFLAARVHLKLDAEFPRFTQALLETVYPHFLAPTPSMLVARCHPDSADPNLAAGFTVPRGSALHGVLAGNEATACEFRTAHDVELWPIEIASASYFSYAPDLPLNSLSVGKRIKGGVRLRLKTTGGQKFQQLKADRLVFYLHGEPRVANAVYELCMGSALGAVVLPHQTASGRRHHFLPASSMRSKGFDDSEALLPVNLRAFQGYRLLQEYFAFPNRFRFVEVGGLARAFAAMATDTIELVLLFGRGEPTLENVVDVSNVSLFCTPAINLFPKRADRIHVGESAHEYHVVPDRTRSLDYEVYEITSVVGHGVGAESAQSFLPLYASFGDGARQTGDAFFTIRRQPRLVSAAQQRRGTRSSYIGSDVFMSLVDAQEAPFHNELRQLAVQTVCTNRDLALQMPIGLTETDFTLDIAAPVKGLRVVGAPSRPYGPLADGSVSWRAISHLSLNYFSLVDASPAEGASALRDLLSLYATSGDVSARRQIDGVRSVGVAPVVRRLPVMRRANGRSDARTSAVMAFGRGLEIDVDVDEMAFEGGSAFLFGCVLQHFFTRYVSINSFTETVLRSPTRGEIHRWMPQWGARQTL